MNTFLAMFNLNIDFPSWFVWRLILVAEAVVEADRLGRADVAPGGDREAPLDPSVGPLNLPILLARYTKKNRR